MPRQVVFPCPSCGASLSVDEGTSAVQCQFCGNTAVVPAAMRGTAPQSGAPYMPPTQTNLTGNHYGLDQARIKAIGDAVRGGNKAEAVRRYQDLFGVGRAEAQQAVDSLAAGRPVMVGTTSMGAPEYIEVASVAPPAPYVVPMLPPMIGDPNRVWRGVFGLNIAITAAVLILTVCISAAAILPFGLMAFPGVWSGLAHLFSQLTSR